MDCVNESKAAFWPKQIEDWKNSGLSQAKFCRERGLKEGGLSYWKRKFDPGYKAKKSKKIKNFIDLSAAGGAPRPGVFKMAINGTVVEFGSLPDPAWIADLIKNLGGASNVLH